MQLVKFTAVKEPPLGLTKGLDFLILNAINTIKYLGVFKIYF